MEPSPSITQVCTRENSDLLMQIIGKHTLLASSQVLSLASPFFKTLLSPKYERNKAASETDLKTVEIHVDDTIAFVALLKILHGQSSTLRLSADEIHGVAVLARMYLCVPAVSGGAQQIVRKAIMNGHTEGGLPRLLYAAYVFDDDLLFQLVTKSMVYSQPGSTCSKLMSRTPYGVDEDTWAALPGELLETSVEHEHSLKSALLENIESMFHHVFNKPRTNPSRFRRKEEHSAREFTACDGLCVANMLSELRARELWPLSASHRHPISYILDQMFVTESSHVRSWGRMTFCDPCGQSPEPFWVNLHGRAGAAFEGLCLQCVRKDCRFDHGSNLGLREEGKEPVYRL